MAMQLFDRATTGAPRRTTDGYLVADVKVARTGIQSYLGSELDKPNMKIVRVYRPESVVFAADSIASYAYRTVTNNHPDGGKRLVSADTWKEDAVGITGSEVVRDGDYVRVSMSLMDAAAIADYESGKRELSMGYEGEIEYINGVTDSGEEYDAVFTSMRMNHLALVNKARGGENLRIGDSPNADGLGGQQTGGQKAMTMKQVMVDGLTVETTVQGAQAIEKLQAQVSDSAVKLQAVQDSHAAALAKKDAEIDALKAKVLSDADIDARVAARADLISKAKAVHDADYSGLSDSAIRRAVVVAKLGDAAIAGKIDAYVDARFDVLVEDSASNADPVRKALGDAALRNPQPQYTADAARAAFIADLENAHKAKK